MKIDTRLSLLLGEAIGKTRSLRRHTHGPFAGEAIADWLVRTGPSAQQGRQPVLPGRPYRQPQARPRIVQPTADDRPNVGMPANRVAAAMPYTRTPGTGAADDRGPVQSRPTRDFECRRQGRPNIGMPEGQIQERRFSRVGRYRHAATGKNESRVFTASRERRSWSFAPDDTPRPRRELFPAIGRSLAQRPGGAQVPTTLPAHFLAPTSRQNIYHANTQVNQFQVSNPTVYQNINVYSQCLLSEPGRVTSNSGSRSLIRITRRICTTCYYEYYGKYGFYGAYWYPLYPCMQIQTLFFLPDHLVVVCRSPYVPFYSGYYGPQYQQYPVDTFPFARVFLPTIR